MTSGLNTAALDVMDGVFGVTSVVFYIAAAEGDFALSYVSRNIGRVLGVMPEACVGSDTFWYERVHVEDTERVLGELAGLVAGGCCTQEFRFRDDRNNYRWVCNEVAFKCGANGATAYMAGCLHDISEVKSCTVALAKNLEEQSAREHFYRSVLDSMPQRLFWKDRNSVFRGCNLSGAHALNLFRTDEIDGKTDYDFYSNYDDANYLHLQDQQVMNSGQASYHAETHAQQDNTWLDVTKVPLLNENGEVYGLLISYEDITVRKLAEEALAESEARYRSLFENMLDGFAYCKMLYDDHGCPADFVYLHVNDAFKRLTGLENVEGKPVSEVIPGIREHNPELFDIYGRVASTGIPEKFDLDLKPLGKFFVISVYSPGNGYFVAVFDDITERKQIEATQLFLAESGYKQRDENFFQALTKFLARALAMDYVFICQLEDDMLSARTVANYRDGKFEDNVSCVLKDMPCGDVVAKRVCCFPANVRHLFPQDAVLQNMLAESYVGVMLFGFDGKPTGLIAAIGRKPLVNPHQAETLLQMVAVRAVAELEHQKSGKMLHESEARLREITSTVGESIYVVDSAGTITFANPAAAKLLGRNSEYLPGNNACGIINCWVQNNQHECATQDYENQATRMENCWLDKIKRLRKTLRIENVFFKRKDGSRFQVSIIATPIFHDGQITGTVVAFHDITEQIFTHKLLNDTLQELRTILDNAQIGVAYLRENKFIWFNKHMGQMFGYTVNELLEKPMEMIHVIDANEQDRLTGEIYGLLAKGEIYENERLMKKSTGEMFWCHLRGIAIDPNDPAKGSIWIMLDIDRLKKTENRLETLNETLALRVEEETHKSLEKERLLIQQGRNAAMGEMIGNIAHQWRQPLSTLGLAVQNIHADYREKILNDSALEKYVETAKQAIQRMSCTIDDFRNFFRPNRVRECFSIYQAIYEAIQLLDAMLKNNGIAVRLTGNQRLKALGHPNEFSQVILNFMVNAKDALIERAVPQGRIDIELSEHDGRGVAAIRDNAGGVNNEDMEKIFDPYFTTKLGGTGIGLYINKMIIEKHMNGSITFRNTSEGAEFTIIIPLEPDCVTSEDSKVKDVRH